MLLQLPDMRISKLSDRDIRDVSDSPLIGRGVQHASS